jgi:phosphoribosylformylglycinamidine synthase subunit PurL
MGAKGDLGIELDLDKRCRAARRHDAYEMMLSESQERMLMVLRPEKEAEAEAIFRKWGLDFAIVGRDHRRSALPRASAQGGEVANLPIKDLGDEAPEYDRPWVAPKPPAPLARRRAGADDLAAALLSSSARPTSARAAGCGSSTTPHPGQPLQRPRRRCRGGARRGPRARRSPSTDVTPRYVEADPFEGGKQAVAECWRNLTAVGAEPLAVTDNLNFGNPERPEIMGQFVAPSKASARPAGRSTSPSSPATCRSTTRPTAEAILPTPTIGGVGLIADLAHMATLAFKAEGDVILLIGGHGGHHLGQSLYLREIHGREDGPPPPVDLARERRTASSSAA